MLKKEFWKYFFNTYKNAKWLILRYLIVAVYLTVSSVIANKMELVNLTYFNAIIGIAYFSEIIGFGISNGIGIYINQNIKNKNKVDYYIKIGGYINCFCSLVFVVILAGCYYPILHLLLELPKNINYTFYFIMLIYMFLMSNLAYFMNILKELKLFFSEMIVSIIQSILIVGGFLLIWFSFNLVLYLIAIIYIFTTLCALIFCFVYFYKNKHVQIQLFKFVKIKFIKNEFMVYWRSFMSQFVWQIGYIMLSYFILRVSEVVFNQYSYFENVLDIFNGFLFAFITITSIDICRKLGEGDFDEAYKIGKYSLYSSIIIWLFYAICSLSFSSLIIRGMSHEIKDLAFISLILYVLLHLFRFLSWNLFSYILSWGGKVKLIMWQEIIATLYYTAFYFLAHLLINNIYLIYFIILVPVLSQTILGLIVFKRKNWMEKLSVDNEVKVIIFDFDDTLYSGVDWENWNKYCEVAINILFKSLSKKDYKKVNTVIEKKGFSDEEIVKQLIKYNLEVQTWIDYRENNKCEIDYSNCQVVDNKVLKQFAEKYHLYIVSNSTLKEIYDLCDYLKIDLSLFKGVFDNKFDKKDISKKLIYNHIISIENKDPSELFVIGNSYKHDIKPALEIGARAQQIEDANFRIEDFGL